MSGYYDDRLSGERLRTCYELAPPRIRQYLEAEIRFVAERLKDAGLALELGCGYGRVLRGIAGVVSQAVGCDTSRRSLLLARSYTKPHRNIGVVLTDATRTGFRSGVFDTVFCVQNGISAFGVDPGQLVSEALRVTRLGGRVLFSSYSPRIWEERLAWFRLQAKAGLLGEIDEDRTGDGTIVCKDGFRAGTVTREEFAQLFERVGVRPELREVDESSLFCVATK
ncbi:MAG TPA: class I SAM-dependent methyltransferase [Thermoplasmata archaeon]|nr:class I SAM-dependent methyltransferase [Thermoplasmata archaeon]